MESDRALPRQDSTTEEADAAEDTYADSTSTNAFDDAMASSDAESSSGTDSSLSEGDNVKVEYVVRLAGSGKEVYRQWGAGDGGSFNFELGAGHVIPGFDDAVSEMQVGEEKHGVVISAADAYGSKGFQAMGIPADADLEYDLKVVSKN